MQATGLFLGQRDSCGDLQDGRIEAPPASDGIDRLGGRDLAGLEEAVANSVQLLSKNMELPRLNLEALAALIAPLRACVAQQL